MRRIRGAAMKALAMMTAGLVAAGCSNGVTENPPGAQVGSLRALPRAVSASEQKGIEAINVFSYALLRAATNASSGNVLLSPFSVSTALGLTMNGAAGSTETAMRNTLFWGTQSRAE